MVGTFPLVTETTHKIFFSKVTELFDSSLNSELIALGVSPLSLFISHPSLLSRKNTTEMAYLLAQLLLSILKYGTNHRLEGMISPNVTGKEKSHLLNKN